METELEREDGVGEFEAMSVERSVAAIRAWADAVWPLMPEDGDAICSRLGWLPDPESSRFYYSGFNDGKDRDISVVAKDGKVWSVTFYLTTRLAVDEVEKNAPFLKELASAVTEQISVEYGKPSRTVTPRGAELIEWELADGVTIDLAHNPRVLMVTVDSPARTALLSDPSADPNPDERL